MSDPWLEIDCGPNVLALQTICHPEPSPFGSFNLDVLVTMRVLLSPIESRLTQRFGREVYFPQQVHGIEVICVDQESPVIAADAVVTDQLHCPIGIMTADCLPVLFASQDLIGAAHAGWRGLVAGVLEQTLQEFPDPAKVRVWLGPCIGRDAFEVGPEVVDAFVSKNADWGRYFKSVSDSDRSMADLQGIACDLLENLGVVTFTKVRCVHIQRLDAMVFLSSIRCDRANGKLYYAH